MITWTNPNCRFRVRFAKAVHPVIDLIGTRIYPFDLANGYVITFSGFQKNCFYNFTLV
jgi:hypothetical protein